MVLSQELPHFCFCHRWLRALGDILSWMPQGIMAFPPDPDRSLASPLLSVLLSQLIPKVGCRFPQGWSRHHLSILGPLPPPHGGLGGGI